ncbi:centromere protein O isoform X1 [Lagopus leucura]|uniref:centromere protein O isoform X1 n=1 Tax=Lagopus leucura TaxID=30410 RepID=UPI001C66F9E0|nr:centromere protein O isoform X1 [Lagopus leucura]
MEEGRDGDGKENAMHGVLGYLEMLEAQAHELGLKQEEKEQQEKKLNRLKARVQELRTRRDELRAKVELQEKRLLDKEGVVTDPARPSAQTVLEWKVKSIKAMLQVFYLTGISGKLTKQGVCFCISTAYEGTYLDSYYVDLLIKPEVKIQRHSVPVFIPLEQIAKKYLQTDIRRFLSVLWEHLNAYVGRRHQADQLEEHFSDHIEGTLQRNSLCNLLVFNYTVSSDSKTFPFNVRLLYGDLCCSLPTEAIISCTHWLILSVFCSLSNMAWLNPDLCCFMTNSCKCPAELRRHFPISSSWLCRAVGPPEPPCIPFTCPCGLARLQSWHSSIASKDGSSSLKRFSTDSSAQSLRLYHQC